MKKIVFCGFGKLGKDCLERLIDEGYTISFIFTHKELQEESVDTFAKMKNLEYCYKDARKYLDEVKPRIIQLRPDYLVSVNYRYIIPREIFEIPKFAINIHGSLLPKYRGRTPHVWSIINGEEYSGITAHIIEETVDTGDIIAQIPVKIDPNDTGYSLLKKFEGLYPDLLINSINKLENNEPLLKQNENNASFFGKRTPEMGYIDFYKESYEIINFVRAQAHPYPGAYYYLIDGKKIIINRLIVEESISLNLPIGVITNINNDYYVKCKDNVLKIVDYKIVNY
ncbi:methionyl-tRNA formyltransferase [Calidifontibacillus erzurumensis]|uniref:Methionyl-tRNA formyltransferase n=1 Tax=Calidifontibacillus erzurumensis TaxID=2741433 RepID=A0A8J8GE14_9BACI|nr:methionyl-tRNA formyltransferase [Calidifontibacillus erzurumensis]NSL51794.1 methionyl-tRNA formyltransferase [Calidifontibacillus erzurumensis]